MKQKYEVKGPQSLAEFGRAQGSRASDEINDFLPQEVSSAASLCSATENFQHLDIQVLAGLSAEETQRELGTEIKAEPDPDGAEIALVPESISESWDPVRLYLKEMNNFQLLSREQEVTIAKRMEAGEKEVEEEVLRSPLTLDLVLEIGARVAAGEACLGDLFEEYEEPTDDDEEHAGEVNEKLKELAIAMTKLKSLHRRFGEFEQKLQQRPPPILKAKFQKSRMRLLESATRELHALKLSHHLQEGVVGEMRRLLQQARDSQMLIQRCEKAAGRSRWQLLRDAAAVEDRHLLKLKGSSENLLDIATRVKAAQKTIKAIERRAKVATGEFARSLETIAAGQVKAGTPSRS